MLGGRVPRLCPSHAQSRVAHSDGAGQGCRRRHDRGHRQGGGVSIKLVLKAQRTRVLAATTHYEVLGVAVRAEPADVKLAHRELARLFHPDFSRLEDAHELMAKVNVAYA